MHRPNRQMLAKGASGTRNAPERVLAHERKMQGKFFRNKEEGRGLYEQQLAGRRLAPFRVGRSHPDFGLPYQTHILNKAKRALKAARATKKAN